MRSDNAQLSRSHQQVRCEVMVWEAGWSLVDARAGLGWAGACAERVSAERTERSTDSEALYLRLSEVATSKSGGRCRRQVSCRCPGATRRKEDGKAGNGMDWTGLGQGLQVSWPGV